MNVDAHRIALILRKEWLEIRQQRGLLLTMAFLPVVFTLIPLVTAYIAGFAPADDLNGLPPPSEIVKVYPALAGLPDQQLIQAIMGPPLSMLLLLAPVILPSIIASYSIVGEKVNQTLEPLLATPVSTWELLVAKIVSSLAPAIVITWFFSAIYIVGIWFIALSPQVFAVIISPSWLIMMLLC